MAVWWVFQNKSYERSRDGGYLWAPLLDKAGHKKSHWETMAEVRPGDVVFSCRGLKGGGMWLLMSSTLFVLSTSAIAQQSPPPCPRGADLLDKYRAGDPDLVLTNNRVLAEFIHQKHYRDLDWREYLRRTGFAGCSGVKLFRDGAIYKGELRFEIPEGYGVLIKADGERDVGEFRDGKLTGQGIRYSRNGATLLSGRWESGDLVQSHKLDASRFPFDSIPPVNMRERQEEYSHKRPPVLTEGTAEAKSTQYRLGQAIGALIQTCYQLSDLKERYCSNLPRIEIKHCIASSSAFLNGVAQQQVLTAFGEREMVDKYTRNSRFSNDYNFGLALRENNGDRLSACTQQWGYYLDFRENTMAEAVKLNN